MWGVFQGAEYEGQVSYGLVQEPPHEEAFMTDHPINILRQGKQNKMPIMIGYNDKEGMLSHMMIVANHGEFRMFQNFEKKIPWTFELEKGSKLSKKVADILRNYYFNGTDPTEDMMEEYYNVGPSTLRST